MGHLLEDVLEVRGMGKIQFVLDLANITSIQPINHQPFCFDMKMVLFPKGWSQVKYEGLDVDIDINLSKVKIVKKMALFEKHRNRRN